MSFTDRLMSESGELHESDDSCLYIPEGVDEEDELAELALSQEYGSQILSHGGGDVDGSDSSIPIDGKLLFGDSSSIRAYPIFDRVQSVSPRLFRQRVVDAARDILRGAPKPERDRWSRRFKEFERCGAVVAVRKCECCGEERVGSGSYAGSHRTCKWTTCPTCGWVRSKKVQEFYNDIWDRISGPEDYKWQFYTVTTKYNPFDEEDVTVEALRRRTFAIKKAVSTLWNKVLKCDEAAMFRTIECSVRGHVHSHVLYFGPELSGEDLTVAAQDFCGQEIGHVHREVIEFGDQMGNQLPVSIERAVRYMAKGTSGYGSDFDEDYQAGLTNGVGMDPVLAARWEIASQRIHLSQKYGALRGIKYQRSDYTHEEPDDSEVACQSCGVVGEWKNAYRSAELWIVKCHDEGVSAFVKGKWKPPWLRGKGSDDG